MPVLLRPVRRKRFRSPIRGYYLCENLSDAVQRLLTCVLSEMNAASQEAEAETSAQKEASVAVLEWRPDPGAQVARTIANRRAERDARYQQAVHLREGERLDIWLTRVQESCIPGLASFAHGVEQDKAAVRAGLTLPINKGQTEGHVTRMKRDLAYDVRQGRVCTPATTRASSDLKTNGSKKSAL